MSSIKCELSIIIPIHDSYVFVKRCLDSLVKIKGVEYEIILVDDASTDPEIAGLLKSVPFINVLRNPTNLGFIKSCNLAAEQAIGEYLLFLNSDTELIEPLSFRYMLDIFKNKKDIGVVGAKLLLENDTVQHAGMRFKKSEMNFAHRFYGVDKNDPRVLVPEAVEGITGACFMTPKKLWDEIGGWDTIYGKGYFEDTEYTLQIKEKGFSAYYCAEAVLYHYQSKSFDGGPTPEHFNANWEVFKERWVRTGKVCEYPKIAACYIVFNEEDFLEYSLKSIYDFVSKIIIVDGASKAVADYADINGESTDKTLDIIRQFPDPDNKIRLIQGKWKDKTEQRNAYCGFLDDMDYAFIIDGDEVWDEVSLGKIENMIFARPDIPALCFNFYDFWQDFSHRSLGPWEQFTGRKSLINLSLTGGGITYDTHTLPLTKDGKNIPFIFCDDVYFFHYSYCRPDKKTNQKINYYTNNGTPGYRIREDWYEVVWMGWKKDPILVEKEYGTHPFGGGWTEKWIKPHPKVMEDHPLYKQFIEDDSIKVYMCLNPIEKEGFKVYCVSNNDLGELPINPESVSLLEVDNALEHFPYIQTADLIFYWASLIKRGGVIKITVPNLTNLTKAYVEGKIDYAEFMVKMYSTQNNECDFHLVAFDKLALETLLKETGFSRVKEDTSPDSMILTVSGRRE